MFNGKTVAAIVVAAGRSARMGFDKLFVRIGDTEVLRLAAGQLDAHPAIDRLVVVAGENIDMVRDLFAQKPLQKPLAIVPGGAQRTHSVAAGLAAVGGADFVAIHDGARPFVSEKIITDTLEAALREGAAAPALPLKDTVKTVNGQHVAETLPRGSLRAVQTPQIFCRSAFQQALDAILPEDYASLTDDCMVMERAGHPVCLAPGAEENRKITTPEDLRFLTGEGQENENRGGWPVGMGGSMQMEATKRTALRVGHGYDVHRLVEGRALVLGGVNIPWEKGLLGHSDADVLLHAISDALLGAAALGDIGQHFPDTDPTFAGVSSLVLLQRVAALLQGAGAAVVNVDASLLCQKPKLAPHIPAMRENIATALGLALGAVSVKATTEEGLGFTGTGEGIAAHSVVMIDFAL